VPRRLTWSLVVVLAINLAACGQGTIDRQRDPLVLDWKRGTYHGVRLGDGTTRLIRILGRPQRRGRDEPGLPIGAEACEIGVLTNHASPDIGRRIVDFEELRYEREVFGITGDRVVDWGTTDQRAQTPEGVGVGDSRERVKRVYPRADCFIQNEGTEYAPYPICAIRVCKGRLLGLGGSPIKSIWLAAETKQSLKHCERP